MKSSGTKRCTITNQVYFYYCMKPSCLFCVFHNIIRAKTYSASPTFLFLSLLFFKDHCVHCADWKTLTLPRTGGQTAFSTEIWATIFSHYSATLIYRNTKIRLNGAIFSFAFRGHFTCLKNSGNLDGTWGSIVIIASSVRVQKLGAHSPAESHRSVLEFSPLHTPNHVNQQLWQNKEKLQLINKKKV